MANDGACSPATSLFGPAYINDEQLASEIRKHTDPPTGSSNIDVVPPGIFLRIPRLFRYDDAPREATGLAMDIFARATILMSSIFLGPALLELSSQAVAEQCTLTRNEEGCLEMGKIYGFKPSSLLSNIAILSGFLGSFFMPIFGAIVDHTSYRWQVGAFSGIGLVFVKGIEAMVSSKMWFPVSCLQVVSAILSNLHLTTILAYTSELSDDPTKQTRYNTYYFVVMYLATLLFLIFVTLVAFLLNQNDIGTARISQITTSSVSALVFYFCWKYLFPDRPALSDVPDGQSLLSCGFRKVFGTFSRVTQELPALKWLTIAIMLGEAATSTLITIATTYMKSFLEMTSSEISLVFLAVLIMGAPGSKIGESVALQLNPIKSAILCDMLFIINTTIAAMCLTGPQHKHYVPLIGAVWGLGLGWLHPMHTTAFITIIPRGQEAELMGLYIFSGQVLSWLPPVLFTALNESGFNMAYGLVSLDIFFLLAIMCLFLVGNYERALEIIVPYRRQLQKANGQDEGLEMSTVERTAVGSPFLHLDSERRILPSIT